MGLLNTENCAGFYLYEAATLKDPALMTAH